MDKKQIKVRISRGDIVIELEGDSSTVISELRALKKEGVGKLDEFFSGVSLQQDVFSQDQSGSEQKPPKIDIKGFLPLKDIVLKDLPKSEPEWIVVYSYFASNGGKKQFTRKDLWQQYKGSKRDTKSRRDNLTNNITQAVRGGWISAIATNTFSLLQDGIVKAKNIVTRKKRPKKRTPRKKKKKIKKGE